LPGELFTLSPSPFGHVDKRGNAIFFLGILILDYTGISLH
jgi:hypothetical protein